MHIVSPPPGAVTCHRIEGAVLTHVLEYVGSPAVVRNRQGAAAAAAVVGPGGADLQSVGGRPVDDASAADRCVAALADGIRRGAAAARRPHDGVSLESVAEHDRQPTRTSALFDCIIDTE